MIKKLIIMILYGAFVVPLFSTTRDKVLELSIDEAIQIAFHNNLDIKIEKTYLDGKKWAMISSWNIFLPELSLSASLTGVNKPIIDDARDRIIDGYEANGIDLDAGDVYDTDEWKNVPKGYVRTAFNLNLDLHAGRIFEIRKTVLEWEQGKMSVHNAKNELKKNIKKSYFNIILLEQNITLVKKNLEYAGKRYDMVETKYTNQVVSRMEKLLAEYDYERLKPQLSALQADLEEAELELKQMLRIKNEVLLILNSSIDSIKRYHIDEKTALIKCIPNNHEVKSALGQLAAIKNKRNIDICALTPSLSIAYTMDPTYIKSDPFNTDNKWFENINEDWKQKAGGFMFTVSIPLSSLTPFSPEQMTVVNDNFQIKQQKLIIEQLREKTELAIKTNIKKLNMNYQLFGPLQLNIEIMEQAYQLAQSSYQQGSKTLIELKDAEKDLFEANFNLLQAHYDYISVLFELEYILGLELHDITNILL